MESGGGTVNLMLLTETLSGDPMRGWRTHYGLFGDVVSLFCILSYFTAVPNTVCTCSIILVMTFCAPFLYFSNTSTLAIINVILHSVNGEEYELYKYGFADICT